MLRPHPAPLIRLCVGVTTGKLTRLLSMSLGGNSKTAIVVTVSPAASNRSETKSSLQFAMRAQTVVNRATINEVTDKSSLLDQYRKEIAQLRAALRDGTPGQIRLATGELVPAEEFMRRVRAEQEDREQRIVEVRL